MEDTDFDDAKRQKVAAFGTELPKTLSNLRTQVDKDSYEVMRAARPYQPGHRYSEVDERGVLTPGHDTDEIVDPGVAGTNPNEWNYTLFRQDVKGLATLLEQSLNAGDPGAFTQMISCINEVGTHLQDARDDGGMQSVHNAIQGWAGAASQEFRDWVTTPFARVVGRQAQFAQEIGRAAASYREILIRQRADYLGLATELSLKIDPHVETPWGEILWTIAAVGTGVSTFGTGTAALATVASVGIAASAADHYYGGMKSSVPHSDSQKRTIAGDQAYDFIPSANQQRTNVVKEAWTQESAIGKGMAKDIANVSTADDDHRITFNRPTLSKAETDTADELGINEGYHVEDISALRHAGTNDLPATAQFIDDAVGALDRARSFAGAGFGNGYLIGGTRATLDDMFDTLRHALTDARDFLYLAGHNLTAIADTYYEGDETHRLEIERISAQGMQTDKRDLYTDDEYKRDHRPPSPQTTTPPPDVNRNRHNE